MRGNPRYDNNCLLYTGFIAAQKTSEAYKGFRKGRWWDLEMEDVERVRSIDGIKTATPSFALWGQTAVYGENKYECSVKGLYLSLIHI